MENVIETSMFLWTCWKLWVIEYRNVNYTKDEDFWAQKYDTLQNNENVSNNLIYILLDKNLEVILISVWKHRSSRENY